MRKFTNNDIVRQYILGSNAWEHYGLKHCVRISILNNKCEGGDHLSGSKRDDILRNTG